MLKKTIAAAMLVGASALIAAPAAAETACVDAYLEVNAEVLLDQSVCA